MTDNDNGIKKIEPAHPAVIEYDRNKTFLAKTGSGKGAVNRYEIAWLIPATDEEAKNRYDCSLQDLVVMGVQIISHRPNYGVILTEDVYDEAKHGKCQTLADSYKPGQRVVGKSAATKAEAATGRLIQDAAKRLGFSTVEEVIALAEKAAKKMKR